MPPPPKKKTPAPAPKALNIIGSTAQVGGHAQLDAEDINITAGQNTFSEESTSSTKTASASVSTAAPTSVNGSLSNSDTVASASGTTYTNSFISAGSLGSKSDNMTIAGATVMTEGDLNIDTNNLVIKSLQDTHQSNSETTGGSVGYGSSSNMPSSVGYNQSNSTSDSAMVTQHTVLIGGTSGKGEVNLTADKTTIAGAVVASATINDDGTLTDNGNLNIVTDELIIEDIQDHNTSSTEGFSLDTATSGTGTTTVGATNLGNNLEQTTLATLGAGNITKKDGTAHDVSGVNRDLNNTQEVTLDQQTGGLDATVTVDQRVFSENGQNAIKKDFEDTAQAVSNVAQSVALTVEAAGLIIDGFQTANAFNELSQSDPEVAQEVQEFLQQLGSSDKQDLGMALPLLALSPEAITALAGVLVGAGLVDNAEDIQSFFGVADTGPSIYETPAIDPSEVDSNSGGKQFADQDTQVYTTPEYNDDLDALLGYPDNGSDVNANSGGYQEDSLTLDDLLMMSEDSKAGSKGSSLNNTRFANQAEADEAFKQYEIAKNTDTEIVLGRLPDTEAGSQLGMTRLNSDNWSSNVNDAFVQGGIDAGKSFYLGSSPDISNYRTAWNALEGNRGAHPQTVFFREMKQLRDAGYRLEGDYMLPPN